MKSKGRYTVGWLLWFAAFLALEGSALANKLTGDTLSEHAWDWFRVFDPHPGPLFIGLRVVLGLFLTWLAFHLVFGWFTPTRPFPHSFLENPMDQLKMWLKRDALNRAWRSFLHSVIAAGLVGAADAVVQVADAALTAKAGGGAVDWAEVLNAAKLAGSAALFAPLVAYIHRLKLDPSRLPSATPPSPPDMPTPEDA